MEAIFPINVEGVAEKIQENRYGEAAPDNRIGEAPEIGQAKEYSLFHHSVPSFFFFFVVVILFGT